jgi:hypothetical protein
MREKYRASCHLANCLQQVDMSFPGEGPEIAPMTLVVSKRQTRGQEKKNGRKSSTSHGL